MSRILPMITVLVAGFMGYQSIESGSTVSTIYYGSGTVYRETHLNRAGQRHGTFTEFYPDGTVSQETEFSHDVWTRKTHYYPNGQKAHEAVAGDPEISRDWNENGEETTQPR